MRTTVAEGAGREHGSHAGGLAHNLKAQPHAHAIGEACLHLASVIRGHELKCLGADEALFANDSAIEDHLVELQQILRVGKQAASSQRSTFLVRVRRREVADANGFEAFAIGGGLVGGGETGELFFVRPEGSVTHAEWLEDPLFHELRVVLTAGDFDEAAEGVDAGIAVGPL